MTKITKAQRAVGYARVSTDEQAESGLGIEAQVAAITADCERRGWELVEVLIDAGQSGKSLDRPQVQAAFDRIAAGDADVLVVTKLDRLSRRVTDLLAVVDWLGACEARLVMVEQGVDTATTAGRMFVQMLGIFAEMERESARERTRSALGALRARGDAISRPAVHDQADLAERIRADRRSGMTLQAIADALNADQVPTLRGAAMWRPSAVQSVLGYKRPPQPAKATAPLPERTRRRRRSAMMPAGAA